MEPSGLVTLIVPSLGVINRDRMDRSVDLPHPLGPTIARNSPGYTWNERFLIASDADKTVFLAKLGEEQTIENAEKYLKTNAEKPVSEEIQLATTAGEVETFSMRKLLNKLATEDVREE